jgi:hypothetical protein
VFALQGLRGAAALFSSANGGRRDDPEVSQLLYVITNGVASRGHDPTNAADELRDPHLTPSGITKDPAVTVVTVGIGASGELLIVANVDANVAFCFLCLAACCLLLAFCVLLCIV